jgi:hypothetical protein
MSRVSNFILLISPTIGLTSILLLFWWQNPQMTEMQVFQYALAKNWFPILLLIFVQVVFIREVGK